VAKEALQVGDVLSDAFRASLPVFRIESQTHTFRLKFRCPLTPFDVNHLGSLDGSRTAYRPNNAEVQR
jgi:hypothetical protein